MFMVTVASALVDAAVLIKSEIPRQKEYERRQALFR
jgi:hypothetical protein